MGRSALEHAVELATAAGVTTEVELVDARAAEALLDVAARHDATMIVVGTTGESPLKGAVLGSTRTGCSTSATDRCCACRSTRGRRRRADARGPGGVGCSLVDGIEHPARLTVGVVGAGRVGAVLGAALARAGHRVTGASAVSDACRGRAAELLPGVPLVDVATVLAGAELVLLTVPDDALPDLVAGLAETGAWQAGSSSCTPSAGTASACWNRPAPRHVLPLALHPAMTFTGTAIDLDRLAGCRSG